MKIGELSRRTGVSIGTIRYYVSIGLIVPVRNGYQYEFTQENQETLETIKRYKNLGFSLEDTHRIISIERYTYGIESEDLVEFSNLLLSRKAELQHEKSIISSQITAISAELERISNRAPHKRISTGVPIEALPLLQCPRCHKPLQIKNASMDYQYFYEADLDCACGYHAYIHEGILYATSPKAISAFDSADSQRTLYRDSPNSLLSLVQKSRNWLLSRLAPLLQSEGKVIMETHLNSFFFLYKNVIHINKKNLIIVADKFKEILQMYKGNFENLGFDYKILYIVSGDNNFPIAYESVDALIDYNSSNEHSIFSQTCYLQEMYPYLKKDGKVFSTYFYFDPGSRSIKQLNASYPENNPENYLLPFFKRSIKEHYIMEEQANIGMLTDSGEGIVFIFHQKGDNLYADSFVLKKKEKKDGEA